MVARDSQSQISPAGQHDAPVPAFSCCGSHFFGSDGGGRFSTFSCPRVKGVPWQILLRPRIGGRTKREQHGRQNCQPCSKGLSASHWQRQAANKASQTNACGFSMASVSQRLCSETPSSESGSTLLSELAPNRASFPFLHATRNRNHFALYG